MSGQPEDRAGGRTALLAARTLLHARLSAKISNRSQIILFIVATLLITLLGVAAARKFSQPHTLIFAVSATRPLEQQFADKLTKFVEQNSRLYRLRVEKVEGKGAIMSRLAQGRVDIAIARTDRKPPADARAIAILEHDLVLVLAPKGSKIKSLSAIKNRRIVVVGSEPRDDSLVHEIMAVFDLPSLVNIELQPESQLPSLLEAGSQVVVFMIAPKSLLADGKGLEALARKPGFDLVEIDGNKALERRLRGVSAETIDPGLLSAVPRIPADDLDSVGVDELLVVRNAVGSPAATDLVRIVLENKDQLGVDGRYATAIEPPDVDKDAQILAHSGAVDYVGGDVKTFLDQYSDLIYISMSVASIVGSIFVGLYSTVTKASPVRVGALTEAMFEIADQIRAAPTSAAVEECETQIERLIKDMMQGMREGWITNEGFEMFRLAHDTARDAAATRRQALGERPHLSMVQAG
jgi:TRAP-type uncharacterized transport system substrate-binding protein